MIGIIQCSMKMFCTPPPPYDVQPFVIYDKKDIVAIITLTQEGLFEGVYDSGIIQKFPYKSFVVCFNRQDSILSVSFGYLLWNEENGPESDSALEIGDWQTIHQQIKKRHQ